MCNFILGMLVGAVLTVLAILAGVEYVIRRIEKSVDDESQGGCIVITRFYEK